jgi:hypothetical protein
LAAQGDEKEKAILMTLDFAIISSSKRKQHNIYGMPSKD